MHLPFTSEFIIINIYTAYKIKTVRIVSEIYFVCVNVMYNTKHCSTYIQIIEVFPFNTIGYVIIFDMIERFDILIYSVYKTIIIFILFSIIYL